MDWIDKEVGRIKEDDAAKKRYEDRQTAISSQSSGRWSDLRYLLKEAVEKLRSPRKYAKNRRLGFQRRQQCYCKDSELGRPNS